MTKEEILGIAVGQGAALQNANTLLNRFNQPTQTPEPKSRFDFDIPDDQYVEGRQVKALLAQIANQPAPVDPVARQRALSLTIGHLRDKFKDEFKRWPDEIAAECNKLSQDYWDLDSLSTCINIVKSRHIDELVTEKARLFADESHPTIRSGSGGGLDSVNHTQRTLQSEALPRSWVDRAKAAGIDESVVREFAQSQGMTPDQYLAEVEKFGKSAIVRG